MESAPISQSERFREAFAVRIRKVEREEEDRRREAQLAALDRAYVRWLQGRYRAR